MSDDFDKEAEREKLRQQFEAEEEAREATQRMSELLLQGATMTNMHCEECGDPIFRHDGREFCPTCGRTVVGEAAAEAEEAAETTDAAGGAAGRDIDRPAADPDAATAAEDVAASGEAGEPGVDSSRGAEGRATREGPAAPEPGRETGGDGAATGAPATETRTAEAPVREDHPRPARAGADDLDEARAALVRTLTTLARDAEATDDLSRARDLLDAAREAAEAIAAVEAARR